MNKLKQRILFLFTVIVIIVNMIQLQAQEIDASKPTNFYSFVDNTIEYQSSSNQNIYGYRGNLTLAPAEEHLILAEVPLLYNDRTSKFGLGDMRVRYFYLPYKNYDNLLGAFGPSIDVFAPTGSYEDGLGSGSWVLSPGFTVGLMATDWIQFFPILSYQYVSKQITDLIPDDEKKSRQGLTFQIITPIVFNDKFFIQLTPVFSMNDFDNEKEDSFAQEIFASYTINPKMQFTGFFRGNFNDEVYTYRLGLTLYL